MPIYEYLCQDCAYKFELKQSMKEEAVATCERCGKLVTRLISAPAIMFKGTGWYVTDYSDKMKPPTDESASSSATEKKETPASTESTPAAAASAPATTTASSSATPAASTTSSPSPSSGESSSTK